MEKLPFIVKQWLVEKEVLSRRVTLNRCLKRISRQIFTKLNMLMSLNMSNEKKRFVKLVWKHVDSVRNIVATNQTTVVGNVQRGKNADMSQRWYRSFLTSHIRVRSNSRSTNCKYIYWCYMERQFIIFFYMFVLITVFRRYLV